MAWFAAAGLAGSFVGAGVRHLFVQDISPEQKRILDQAEKELLKTQRERQLENLNNAMRQQFYDVVVCPTPFLDVTRPDGWMVALRTNPPPVPVTANAPAPASAPAARATKAPAAAAAAAPNPPAGAVQQPQQLLRSFKGPIVTVRGQFNKGKTFVLNALVHLSSQDAAHTFLPSGNNIHTEGLSFKMVTPRRRPMVFLDTAGSNSPIATLVEGLCLEHKASESFIRDIAFCLADTFIEVVNEVGHNEQEEIAALCLALEKRQKETAASPKIAKVMVIHNFRDVRDPSEFNLKKKDVAKLYDGCELVSEDVEFNGKFAKVEYLDGYGSKKPGGIGFQQHFFLGKETHETSDAGALNPWVLTKIMTIITGLPLMQSTYDLKQRLEDAINANLPKYLEPVPPKVHMDLTTAPTKIRFVGLPPTAAAGAGSAPINAENAAAPPLAEVIPIPEDAGINPVGFHLKLFAGQISNSQKNTDCALHVLENDFEHVILIFMAGVRTFPDLQFERMGDEYVFTVQGRRECPVVETSYTTVLKQGVFYGQADVQFRLPVDSTTPRPDRTEWEDGLLLLVFKKMNLRSGKISLAGEKTKEAKKK